MRIIYHCYGGAHSSVTAAAIHLGWLPTDHIPSNMELEQLPYFDRPMSQEHGNIRLMGLDEFDNEIFICGRRNAAKVFENLARGLTEIYRLPPEQFLFVDVMPYVNWKMVLGGFTSRKMGWAWFGRPVITRGVKFSYWKIVNLVQRVKIIYGYKESQNDKKEFAGGEA